MATQNAINDSSTPLNKITVTQPATGATLTIIDGKTLIINNSLTLSGTDSVTMTFPTTSATVARTDAGQTFTGTQVFSSTITGSISGNSGTATALQNARTIGGTSFDGTANITVATATGGFTVSGGDLALGANNLTMTGSIGSTGSRVTKLWATDITVTNAISGSVTGNAATATALQNARTIAGTTFDGTANISLANKFVVQGTADSGLSAAQFLGSLGTGIIKNTTTTGVLSIAVAGDFPTLNQNTTGSAATLTTTRGIYGNNFDGSAALTQIIASTFGGTGNGFTKFSGPATAEKTFTLPNASATILTDNTVVTVAQGGTGTGTAFTAGSVVFAGASGVYSQSNAQLFWDNTNNRLGINIAAPVNPLEVSGSGELILSTYRVNAVVRNGNSGGNVGFGMKNTGAAAVGSSISFIGTANRTTGGESFTGQFVWTVQDAGNTTFSTDLAFQTTTNNVLNNNLYIDKNGFVQLKNQINKYNNISTVGWGVPAIYGTGRSTAQTAAVASVATYTVGASDGSFIISANANITTFVAGTFNVTVAYTDETNTAQTLKLNFSSLTGTIGIALAATGPFEGIPAHIRCKASTSITIATSGTFTSLTYNVEGFIQQIG